MKESIIEKLGITPGQWKAEHNPHLGHHVFESGKYIPIASHISRNDILLIASAPEMLEALIDSVMIAVEIEQALGNHLSEFKEDMKSDKRIQAIEKATGKSWEEIKELL